MRIDPSLPVVTLAVLERPLAGFQRANCSPFLVNSCAPFDSGRVTVFLKMLPTFQTFRIGVVISFNLPSIFLLIVIVFIRYSGNEVRQFSLADSLRISNPE